VRSVYEENGLKLRREKESRESKSKRMVIGEI
jgi:hypothetical protein